MKNEELKKALLSEIENCNNNDLLLEALVLLMGPPLANYNYFEANETETKYGKQKNSAVPQKHWDLLKAEREEFLKGNIKATAWEEFEEVLKKKYDL